MQLFFGPVYATILKDLPGLEAILQRCSDGSRMVNLFLLTLLTCSTTNEKFNVEARPSLACNELITSYIETCQVVAMLCKVT